MNQTKRLMKKRTKKKTIEKSSIRKGHDGMGVSRWAWHARKSPYTNCSVLMLMLFIFKGKVVQTDDARVGVRADYAGWTTI